MKYYLNSYIKDLRLVCSNCHKIIHRSKPWLSVSELKILLSINYDTSNQLGVSANRSLKV